MLQPLMEGMEIHPSFAFVWLLCTIHRCWWSMAWLSFLKSGLEGNFSSMGTCHVGETGMVHSFQSEGVILGLV